MKLFAAVAFTILLVPGVYAADLADKVTVEIDSAGLQAGMQAGTYLCAAGHLHIKGIVQNFNDTTVKSVKVKADVFDADGKLLGTATGSTRGKPLAPYAKTEVHVEFLNVTGEAVDRVKRKQIAVVEAPSL